MTGPLHDELRELADAVEPTDLYERSLARSRRLGRREAAVGTTAAVVALALLGSGLWQLPRSGPEQPRPAAAPAPVASLPATPTTAAPRAETGSTGTARADRPERPRPARTSTTPRSTSIADLPGHIFYSGQGEGLVRLTPGKQPETVLSQPYATIGVSPDGSRVAYVSEGVLMVADTGGGDPRQAYAGTASAAQAPAWSPDGTQLIVDAAEPGVLDVATGTLTPLPSGLDGRHFRWSGDGSTLVYSTTGCGIEVAEATAQTGTPVPDSGAACRPVSVDATGDLVAVQLSEPATGSADGTPADADAVLDTVTGDLVELPVTGTIIGAVFDAEGYLLVRSVRDGTRRLSLFAPDFTLLLRAREPSALRELGLVAYTR